MRFRAFLLVSADGYAAAPGGDVAWHEQYFTHFGGAYKQFIATIGAVVMGRRTFDQARGIPDWRFAPGAWPGRDTWLLTSRPLVEPIPRVTPWHDGVPALLERLRSAPPAGDVWLMGGPATLRPFRELGAVDRYDLFIAPLLLGGGTPWSAAGSGGTPLTLDEQEAFPDGVLHLAYEPTFTGGSHGVR